MIFFFVGGFLYKYFYLLYSVTKNYRFSVYALRLISLFFISFSIGSFFIIKKRFKKILPLIALFFSLATHSLVCFFRYFKGVLTFYDLFRTSETIGVLEYIFKFLIKGSDFFFYFDFFGILIIFFFLHKTELSGSLPSEMSAPTKYEYKKRINFLKLTFLNYKLKNISLVKIIFFLGIIIYLFPFIFFNCFRGYDFQQIRRHGASAFIHYYGFVWFYTYDFFQYQKRHNLSKSIKLNFPNYLLESENNTTTDLDIHLKKPNIILVQVESLDNSIIDFTVNQKEVTPFLNNLKRRHVYLPKFFAIHTAGSVDADAASLTGSFGIPNRTLFSYCILDDFPSIFKKLKKEGYTNIVAHTNRETYYNRGQALRELGVDKIFFKKHFASKYPDKMEWGLNDDDALQECYEILLRQSPPFFLNFITISSHGPFDWDLKGVKFPTEEGKFSPQIRKYFNSVHFVDQALKKFVFLVKSRFPNTLIVIFGDHATGLLSNQYNYNDYLKNCSSVLSEKAPHNVPLFFIFPKGKRQIVSKYATTIDIFPTIMNILGIEKSSNTFGESIFSKKPSPILFDGHTPVLLYNDSLYFKKNNDWLFACHTKWKSGDRKVISNKIKDYYTAVINYSRGWALKNPR